MIDDIQFIADKTSTQEEFFHTFNDLYQNNKQIIISSDRIPKEINNLDDRIRSRFEWGMIADITPPDLEMRIAILQMKAMEEKFNVSHDVLTFIAERVTTNREMIGLLSKVVFFASLTNKPAATLDIAQEALRDYLDDRKEALNADKIIEETCKYFSVSKDDLTGKRKTKEIVEPRQICIYLMTELLTLPLETIGNILGNRDHTTIIHSRDKIADAVKTNNRIKVAVNDLTLMVNKK
jgi:chromosomal replication initiator protein